VTRETPAPGVVVWQPARGFRYAVDVFWLVGFALEGGIPKTAIDLGTGSGIAAFLLAARGVDTTGIDARPEWEPLWTRSLADSAVSPRLVVEDVRDVAAAFDLAIANPPFFAAGTGPSAPDPWKAAARTESSATLAEFVAAGLRIAPRLCLVLPVEREDEVPASRVVRVGRRRVLVEVGGEPAPAVALAEDDARVLGWVAAARAGTG
jgi:tRNA1Val (adenine37-N6)-methyltransferase